MAILVVHKLYQLNISLQCEAAIPAPPPATVTATAVAIIKKSKNVTRKKNYSNVDHIIKIYY